MKSFIFLCIFLFISIIESDTKEKEVINQIHKNYLETKQAGGEVNEAVYYTIGIVIALVVFITISTLTFVLTKSINALINVNTKLTELIEKNNSANKEIIENLISK